MQTLTTEQIENIVIDVGVVYLDYGLSGQRILAPTRGGNSFVVEQDVRVIERDNALGKEIGLRRVVTEDAMLTVRFMDLSIANLKMALAGSTATSSKITSTTDGSIATAEYFTNVTLIGTDMEGKTKVITLFNAMVDTGMTMDTTDKDEVVVEVSFAGHRDPTNSSQALYTIEETSTAATDLTDLVVSTGTLEPTFAGSTYEYGLALGNATASITVTPTGASADEIRVEGVVVASGVASGSISLDVGVNEINVTVQEDGKSNIEYKIYATREDA